MKKEFTGARYGFIDAIRGIAALLVMLQHSLYSSGLLGDIHGPLTGFIPTMLELGETGVVAFFLVSGFVIPLSLEKTANFKMFWIHRILRIYPLYLCVYFVSLVLHLGTFDISGFSAHVVNFLSHLLMIQEYVKQPNLVGGSWTLSIEMIWYIGLSVLFLLALNKKPRLLVALAVAASFLACVVCAFGPHLPMGRLSMLVCCVLGFVCYRYGKSDLSSREFCFLAGLLIIAIVTNLMTGFLLFPSAYPTASFAMVRGSWSLGILIFFIPFLFRQSSIWDNSLLSFLGKISYSIYLGHGVVLHLLEDSPLTGWWFIAAVFVSTILVASLSYRYIEQPPIQFGKKLNSLRQL